MTPNTHDLLERAEVELAHFRDCHPIEIRSLIDEDDSSWNRASFALTEFDWEIYDYRKAHLTVLEKATHSANSKKLTSDGASGDMHMYIQGYLCGYDQCMSEDK
jgi:hypothetical protein